MTIKMKRYFILLFIFAATLGMSVSAQSLTEQADSAYTSDEFELAAKLYSDAVSENGTSPEILYNLGNCYYRLGKPGKAVLMYERALRLDPTFEDAKENLAFVNSLTTDRPGERGTFFENALDSISLKMTSDTWAWIAFAFFALTIAGVCLYIFSANIPLRKTGFFGGFLSILLCGITLFFAWRCASICSADNVAIITKPSTILSTAPRTPSDRSLEAMLLHEGTKVMILDSVENRTDSVPTLWLDVEVDNSHRAWINAADVERI